MKDFVGLAQEALKLWREYLDGKLERYNLHLKKKRLKALKIADEQDEVVREIFEFVKDKVPLDDSSWKEYYNLKKRYLKLDRKFDRLS